MKKLIFIGAGAIGSYVGGWLSKEGHDVTLVDPADEPGPSTSSGRSSCAGSRRVSSTNCLIFACPRFRHQKLLTKNRSTPKNPIW